MNPNNKYKKNSKEMFDEMFDQFGFIFCQRCNKSNVNIDPPHHIYFRSEKPGHPNLHDKINLIICCFDCHKDLHDHKELRAELVKERNLDKIFK